MNRFYDRSNPSASLRALAISVTRDGSGWRGVMYDADGRRLLHEVRTRTRAAAVRALEAAARELHQPPCQTGPWLAQDRVQELAIERRWALIVARAAREARAGNGHDVHAEINTNTGTSAPMLCAASSGD